MDMPKCGILEYAYGARNVTRQTGRVLGTDTACFDGISGG
ncbi:hypothetical protein Tharo_3408 (plasmid) [Thauera aromatica K172]|uniref:Uncharacterized protein n=1 Tax=Thauera aromatica K172 TaxID=44139 RepID=A0A2R4BSH1_THAAR|nr:hypothetical protein [uncultured bacterium]AVR90289.1 hypothetical protein Tharo_3408 [Thauera aromatica K172]